LGTIKGQLNTTLVDLKIVSSRFLKVFEIIIGS